MVRGQSKKQVLSVGEIQNIKEERKELEATLQEAKGFGDGTGRNVDAGSIKGQIKKLDDFLAVSSPPRISGSERDRMAKRAKDLEEKFSVGMPTQYEMNHPARCPGAVKKHMGWIKRNENTGEVEEYRQIQRTLNPGEEHMVESLRREK